MRDYLYIWNDLRTQSIIASGIESRDLFEAVPHKSLMLLEHEFDEGEILWPSRFMFVSKENEKKLVKDDIYKYGDFSWVDSAHDHEVKLSKQEIAELAYFRQCSKPFGKIEIPSLGNQFMVVAHDDGWFLQIYYPSFKKMAYVLRKMGVSPKIITKLGEDRSASYLDAFYIDESGVKEVETTYDADLILGMYHPKARKKK